MDAVENKIEQMEQKLEQVEREVGKVREVVEKILAVVVGNEFTKNDSMQSKVALLQLEVEKLKTDKIERDSKNKIYMAIAAFLGTAIGGLLVAFFSSIFRK